jgi:uncharacterized membrane protein (UPF0127 family)
MWTHRGTPAAAGRPRLARVIGGAVALLLVVAAAACSDDKGSSGGGSDSAASDETTETTAAPPSTAPPGTSTGPLLRTDMARWAGSPEATVTGARLDPPPGPPDRKLLDGFAETAVSITDATGEVTGCCVLVAVTAGQRERGLMQVTDMGGYDGMLFVWNADTSGGFWMRNTPMPLSIAFFDAEGGFVSATDMAPCDDSANCPTYPSGGTYRFALEVPQGKLADLGVAEGSTIDIGGACSELNPAPG